MAHRWMGTVNLRGGYTLSGLATLVLGVTLLQAVPPAIGQTLQDKVAFANKDINDMWIRKFRSLDRTWITPTAYIYRGSIQTSCGIMGNGNALYCPRSHTIFLNQPFVSHVNHRVGDFAAVTVLAHEYGHAVQQLLGLSTINRYPIDDELQADCFAGIYAQDAMSRGLLDASDIPEATAQSYSSGDSTFNLNSHGTPQQRVMAFRLGYTKGFQACLRYSTWHRK